jgi:general secretion pathway protein C
MERVGFWQSVAALDWRRVAVVAASLLLVVLIAGSLAKLVWLVIEGPSAGKPSAVAPPPVVMQAPPRQFTPDMAAGWTLFGDAAAPVAASGPEDAPATNLSLQLLGTFSTGNDRLAGAVICERGKDGELYRIGAMLPGGAVLEKVEATKVLLRRRGQLEALAFDSAPSSAGGDVAPAGLDMAGGFRNLRERLGQPPDDGSEDDASSRTREALTDLSENLRANPEGVLSEFGLRPVSATQASGYVVGEGSNADMMKSLGLRPGDVVLSVNGKPLGSVRNDARLVDEVKASGEARVEIRRGSQTFTVNYPL